MSFTRKMLTFAYLIVPVLLVMGFSYWQINENLSERAHGERNAIASLSAHVLREKFDHLSDMGLALNERSMFRALVEQEQWQAAIDVMATVPREFPYIERVFLADPSGVLLADTPPLPGVRGRNFAFREWYVGVSRGWKPYITGVYQRAAEPRIGVIALAVPVKDGRGTIRGILVLQVPISRLLEWSSAGMNGDPGTLTVIDPAGHIATAQGIDRKSDPIQEKRVRRSDYQRVPSYGWAVQFAERAEPTLSLDNSLTLIASVYLVAFLLAVGFADLIVRELKRRKAAEETLRDRTMQLAVVNKELDAFSSSVSHDLRAPLRAINGYAELLREEKIFDANSEAERKLSAIVNNTRQMSTLIDDLLSLARLGSRELEKSRVDLNAMAADVLEEINRMTHHNAKVSIGPLPHVSADRGLLHQVFFNLISNAIKYSSKSRAPSIEILAQETASDVRISVRDNGSGFDMGFKDRLFRAFQRLHTSAEFEGTGMGLAIVERIIAKHGGEVWADSEPGRGAVFGFSIPKGL